MHMHVMNDDKVRRISGNNKSKYCQTSNRLKIRQIPQIRAEVGRLIGNHLSKQATLPSLKGPREPCILVTHGHITIIDDESAYSNSVHNTYRNDYFLAHKAAISENRLR